MSKNNKRPRAVAAVPGVSRRTIERYPKGDRKQSARSALSTRGSTPGSAACGNPRSAAVSSNAPPPVASSWKPRRSSGSPSTWVPRTALPSWPTSSWPSGAGHGPFGRSSKGISARWHNRRPRHRGIPRHEAIQPRHSATKSCATGQHFRGRRYYHPQCAREVPRPRPSRPRSRLATSVPPRAHRGAGAASPGSGGRRRREQARQVLGDADRDRVRARFSGRAEGAGAG